MTYQATVLADSVGPHGLRLTTMEVTFPRAYLAEFNTHRMLSRNSESSRAIPTELQIERVLANPYVPEFALRVKGMGVGEVLEGTDKRAAEWAWLDARDAAVDAARHLLVVAKDQANRLLEPFMWHTVIVSATEWDNFFNLRDHEAAAPPMQRIARLMKEALQESEPKCVGYEGWHIPMVGYTERMLGAGDQEVDIGGGTHVPYEALVSAGRVARSSYSNHHKPETMRESKDRWERLALSGHWSPAEHPARCTRDRSFIGNFRGWVQLRKHYPGEAVFHG